jgi:hypothetical protein
MRKEGRGKGAKREEKGRRILFRKVGKLEVCSKLY